jgi:tetratricopeptide (TPR) repeat protein
MPATASLTASMQSRRACGQTAKRGGALRHVDGLQQRARIDCVAAASLKCRRVYAIAPLASAICFRWCEENSILRQDDFWEPIMYRIALCTAALSVVGMVVAPAFADDTDTCKEAAGEDSIAACSRLIERNPQDAVAYTDRGEAYNDKGDYDRAIIDLDEAIRLESKFARAWNDRGFTYTSKGNNNGAISDYDQAIRLDPNYALAHVNRGNVYDSKGDHDRAIFDYDEAIRLDPKYVVAWNNRGWSYNNKGNYDEAI